MLFFIFFSNGTPDSQFWAFFVEFGCHGCRVELKTEQILTGCRTGKFGKIGAGSRADFLSAPIHFSIVLMKVPLIKLCPLKLSNRFRWRDIQVPSGSNERAVQPISKRMQWVQSRLCYFKGRDVKNMLLQTCNIITDM